ncbi:NUDIX domain-containing protein [Colletotrichum karsti]|uniref:NUDIX domain-containing protein n=1 Tax=Colletotrichum karsti TaxID=1095194 RepID=A0A9P6HX38_9PEZI|nr:NUDIX domain-containing protein [Colletotrichum karsti]KAF9872448.1 NUDIX domain-containing protein [Colletotrichum karsti]
MSSDAFANPRVGVAAVIQRKDGRIVVGKRESSHGSGTWQLPGGHLELKEGIFECAVRETEEETELKVRATKIIGVTNDVFEESGKHYVTLFVRCEMLDEAAEPKNLEPEKCSGWYFKTWQEVRDIKSGDGGMKLFLPLAHLVEENPDIENA